MNNAANKQEKNFFSRQLKKIIFEKNITQKDVAKKLGVAQAMISQWLAGDKNPTLNTLTRIADVLGVSVNYFIEESFSSNENESFSEIKYKLDLINEKNKVLEEKIKNLERENSLIKKFIKIPKNLTF